MSGQEETGAANLGKIHQNQLGGQEAPHGDVFIDIVPVNANSAANEAPVGALGWRCPQQTWKPFKRRSYATGVGQRDNKFIVRERNVHGICHELTGQSAHSRR